MKITIEFLNKHEACKKGLDFVIANNLIGQDDIYVLNKLIELDKLNWCNWLLCRLFNEDQRLQYAIYCAESVLHNFEKEFPNDDRPRKAIEAAKRYLNDKSEENIKLAREAACSLDSAAWSLNSAACSAARSAVWSAVWSACSLDSSACSSACLAAREAAWSLNSSAREADYYEFLTKLLQFGIKLYEETINN